MSLRTTGIASSNSAIRRLVARGIPRLVPMTAVWQAYPIATTGTWTTYLAIGSTPFPGQDYFICAHNPDDVFKVGVDGADFGDLPVTFGRWYSMGYRAWTLASGDHRVEWWPDLDDPSSLSTTDIINTHSFQLTATSELWVGGNPWADEGVDARQYGLKIWQAALSYRAMLVERRSVYPVLPQYYGKLWGVHPLRSHRDLRDYSGQGHHFTPVNASSIETAADDLTVRVVRPRPVRGNLGAAGVLVGAPWVE